MRVFIVTATFIYFAGGLGNRLWAWFKRHKIFLVLMGMLVVHEDLIAVDGRFQEGCEALFAVSGKVTSFVTSCRWLSGRQVVDMPEIVCPYGSYRNFVQHRLITMHTALQLPCSLVA